MIRYFSCTSCCSNLVPVVLRATLPAYCQRCWTLMIHVITCVRLFPLAVLFKHVPFFEHVPCVRWRRDLVFVCGHVLLMLWLRRDYFHRSLPPRFPLSEEITSKKSIRESLTFVCVHGRTRWLITGTPPVCEPNASVSCSMKHKLLACIKLPLTGHKHNGPT